MKQQKQKQLLTHLSCFGVQFESLPCDSAMNYLLTFCIYQQKSEKLYYNRLIHTVIEILK